MVVPIQPGSLIRIGPTNPMPDSSNSFGLTGNTGILWRGKWKAASEPKFPLELRGKKAQKRRKIPPHAQMKLFAFAAVRIPTASNGKSTTNKLLNSVVVEHSCGLDSKTALRSRAVRVVRPRVGRLLVCSGDN